MASGRDTRRCALQVLYQLDAGSADGSEVRATLELDLSPGPDAVRDRGCEMANAAWAARAEADAAVAALTPEWPTHRQPVIDRNILRLAYYEMTRGGTPPKVAINEAVELAREFSTDRSPTFVNGVLDRIFKQLQVRSAPGVEGRDGEG
jgi:N utilization substance protein B